MDKKITRFGYILNKRILTDDELAEVKADLTVEPFKQGNYGKAKNNKFPVYLENGDYIGIPKYYGLYKFGEPKLNRLEKYAYPKCNMTYVGKLRPNQQIIVDKAIKAFDQNRGGIIVAGCGSGKTNMAIYLACHYQLKTLWLTHKTFLLDQSVDRILSTTNVKKIGLIRQKKIDIDHPFVVGMIQSICKINYDDAIFKDFGMVIIDEVHHMAARNFSKVYQKISSKYMLGISAERERKDKTYKIINWYMGPIIHFEEQKPNDMVIVKKILYKTSNKVRMETIVNKYSGEADRSTMITNLVHIKYRNRFIINVILDLYDQGKNILFLTGRIKQIDVIHKLLQENEYTKNNVGKYIGGMKDDKLKESSFKQIILGTYEMASEGLDIASLNAVIFGTPKSSIQQSAGRILRLENYEEHPIIIDIVDVDNDIFDTQYYARNRHYQKQKYNVQVLSVADYKPDDTCPGDTIKWDDAVSLHAYLTKKPNKKPIIKQITYSKFEPIDVDAIEFDD